MTSYLTFQLKDQVDPRPTITEKSAFLAPAVAWPGLQGALWETEPSRRRAAPNLEARMHAPKVSQAALLRSEPAGWPIVTALPMLSAHCPFSLGRRALGQALTWSPNSVP